MHKFAPLLSCIAAAMPPAAHAQFGNIINNTVNTVSNAAQSAAQTAQAAAQSLAATSASTAAAVQNTGKATINTIGTVVFDATQTMKSVAKNADGSESFELVKGGKSIGRVAVKGGKVVATEVVDAAGRVTSTPVAGAKLIVNNGKVTGREIIVGGKLIGEEVFDASGKVVRNTLYNASATAEYVLNKAGELVLNALSPEICKSIIAAKNGAQNLTLPAVPNVPGLPTVQDTVTKLNSSTAAMRARVNNVTVKPLIATLEKTYAPQEFQRARDLLASKKDRILSELFTEQLICSGDLLGIEDKMKVLGLQVTPQPGPAPVQPKAGESYFQAISFGVAAAKYLGAVISVTFATNFKGQRGLYFSVGAQGALNVGAGGSLGLGFNPAETLDSMGGLGFGVAVSAATAKGYPDVGLDIAMNEPFSEPNGYGVSLAYGVGGKFPADVSVGASYTVPIKLQAQ